MLERKSRSAMGQQPNEPPTGYRDLGSAQLPTDLLGDNQFEENLLRHGSIFGATFIAHQVPERTSSIGEIDPTSA